MSLKEFNNVGIAVDNYKVKRFRAVLAENGFETKVKKGLTKDTAMLNIKAVHVDKLQDLTNILARLQDEFARRN
jgi:hypothetical protein